MILEILLLTTMFALTAVGFIGVLNARGVWRTSVASVLVLGCLSAALWQVTVYRAAGMLRATGVEGTGLGGGVAVTGALAEPDVDAGWNQGDGIGDGASEGLNADELIGLTAGVRALRDSMSAEDPTQARALSDSDYQAFEGRAEHYLSQARLLRERAARLAAQTAPSGSAVSIPREEVAEALNAALHSLTAAARDLRGFFRATGREEELRLSASFRKGLEAAEAPLRRAETGAGALARPADFEAREP